MVAMNVWPTDASDGSVATEARWRKMGRLWTPTGVVAGAGTALLPSLAGTNLTVRAGACWVDGHFCELLGDQVLTATANGLVVVRLDPAANTAELLYRDGVALTPTQNPTGIWELLVADVVGSALTDRRSLICNWGAARSAVARNAANLDIASASPRDLGTVTSLPCSAGESFLVEVSGWATCVGGNTSAVLWLGIEASGGGISAPAASSDQTDRAALGGGTGQTLQTPMFISKVFTTLAAGNFAAGGRGWTSSVGTAGVGMSNNRCVITRLGGVL